MINIEFHEPQREKTIEKIRSIEVYGRPLRTNRNAACVMCSRSVQPLGRLAWPGAPLCTRSDCELTSMTKVTEIFTTPYGRAIGQQTLRIFCTTLEKDMVLVQRSPVIERAEALVDGHIDLIRWQKAYHDFDRLSNPERYDLGQVTIVPPRRLDEVLVFRSIGQPVPIDPTRNLPADMSRMLHRIRREGSSAMTVPF